jgi:hypothetical protein
MCAEQAREPARLPVAQEAAGADPAGGAVGRLVGNQQADRAERECGRVQHGYGRADLALQTPLLGELGLVCARAGGCTWVTRAPAGPPAAGAAHAAAPAA